MYAFARAEKKMDILNSLRMVLFDGRTTLLLITLFCIPGISQAKDIDFQKKKVEAVRTDNPPKIDGSLNDEAWNQAPVLNGFMQYSPYSGRPATFPTEVRILYDDEALYVGAFMSDPNPDSIFVQLGQRDADRELNADFFSIEISTFNDGINGETFKVSASGVQSDRKARTAGGGGGGMGGMGGGMGGMGDGNWDAVWFSRVEIVENGWIAELKIPYSALRFPKVDKQTWGVNFFREVRRFREISSWSYVDREVGTTFSHLGELTGLSNLVPPVRLSITPYVSGYLEKYDGERPGTSYSGGLDMKLGLNESFTLDMTLIPDFGQVQSDDQVLNLSPYEVRYNERRPFFMEGTELFSRGGIFYSRRIGSRPRMYSQADDDLGASEMVTKNPQEAALINASKLSGRTKTGLGIGVFNAVTRQMWAEIEDTLTGEQRKFKTEPLSNFNMLVLDQSLKNNSFISLANTNVLRDAPKDELYYTANVTAVDFRLQNSTRKYSVAGTGAVSQKYYQSEPDRFGNSFSVNAGKTGGTFRFNYQLEGSTDSYDINDMGYMRRNNEFQNSASVSYNTFKPFWKIYTTRTSLSFNYNQLYNPRVFTGSSIGFSSFVTLNNNWSVNMRAEYSPGGEDDYFEPRITGRFFHRPEDLNLNFWFDSDRSKKYSFNLRSSVSKIWSEYDQKNYSVSVDQQVTLSTRFTMGLDIEYSSRINSIGYVSYNSGDDEIIFGKRDNNTFTTTLQSGYIFTADSYLSFRLRHYWSRADYDGTFFNLLENGLLAPGSYAGNPDYNYNAFNIDMVYTWRFAPGSELTLVWKNAIYSGGEVIFYDYLENLSDLFRSSALNSLSLKILYYLDYQSLRKRS